MQTAFKPASNTQDLVSVIITCFNHSDYLTKAIESVLEQTYKSVEIVVVDDGSTDDTKQIAESFEHVKYIYQQNQGLSAARNTGIINSSGNYLIFLDADDWLLPDGIVINIKYFNSHNSIGLVSGNYMRYYENTGELKIRERIIKEEVYGDLLLYNHLRMHGAVMFPRFVFNNIKYDTKLRSGEDWDITLNISRDYLAVQHNEPVAVYRKYGTSMSSNHTVMLHNSLMVLIKQKKNLRTPVERKNFKLGSRELKKKFTNRIYNQLVNNKNWKSAEIITLLKYNPVLLLKLFLYKIKLINHKG